MEADVIQRIRQRLKELGLSPRAASLKAGLNSDAIRNIFRGRSRNPRYDTFNKIARVLECGPHWLLTGEHRRDAGHGLAEHNANGTTPSLLRPVANGLDVNIYATIFDEFSQVYRSAGVEIATRDLAALALDEYNDIVLEMGQGDEAEVADAARRAAARLSRFLRAHS